MAKVLEVILLVISAGCIVGLSFFKRIYLYRNDPAKRDKLLRRTPRWVGRFILGEDADTSKPGRK